MVGCVCQWKIVIEAEKRLISIIVLWLFRWRDKTCAQLIQIRKYLVFPVCVCVCLCAKRFTFTLILHPIAVPLLTIGCRCFDSITRIIRIQLFLKFDKHTNSITQSVLMCSLLQTVLSCIKVFDIKFQLVFNKLLNTQHSMEMWLMKYSLYAKCEA